jgi:hypothetical protein
VRRRVTAVLLALAWLAMAAPDALAQNPGGWMHFSHDAGRFTVLVPARPTESSRNESGTAVSTFRAVHGPMVFAIVIVDYPPSAYDVEDRLGSERDGFLTGSKGRLRAERRTSHRRGSTDLPGLEFTSDAPERDANYRCRVFLDGDRVYFLLAGSPKGHDATVDMARFLDSFQVR